jgi:hypothetical protein
MCGDLAARALLDDALGPVEAELLSAFAPARLVAV